VVFNKILLFTRLSFLCNWLKLYNYVKFVTEKLKNIKRKHRESAEFRAGPSFWAVVVADLVFWSCLRYWLEVASSGSAGLVVFWILLVFFGWSSVQGRPFFV